VKVLNKYLLCPDCGHIVFGYRCKWCNRVINTGKPEISEEKPPQACKANQHPKQKVVEISAEDKPEMPGTITMIAPVNRRQQQLPEVHPAENSACKYTEDIQIEAELNSAELIADAKQKAEKLLREAEQVSMESANAITAEAKTKSDSIINDSRQQAETIINGGKKAAEELENKSRLEAEALSNEIIAKAEKQADQIIQEARQTASVSVKQENAEKPNDKVTGWDIIISSLILLAGIMIIVSAILYVQYKG
jgi:vacuolar-type H+-ATPase subunit H